MDWERDSKGYTLWEKPGLKVQLRECGGVVVESDDESTVVGIAEGEGKGQVKERRDSGVSGLEI